MTKTYKIAGQQLTAKEINQQFHEHNHPLLVKLNELYNEIYGSRGTGSREEYEKSVKVNRNLFASTEEAYIKYHKTSGQNYPRIWKKEFNDPSDDSDDKILNIIKQIETSLTKAQEVANLMEQLKKQRDETGNEYNEKPYQNPNPDQSREEWKQKADNLRKWRQEATTEIENSLNTEPKISTSDLEGQNQSWQLNLENAILGKEEIDQIKERVLTDIKSKRATKLEESRKRKRPREDDNQDTPNKKQKTDKNELERLISQAQQTHKFEDLKPIIEKINAFEGEEAYQQKQSVINSLKMKMGILNRVEYKRGVVNNLQTRFDKIKDKGNNTTVVNKLEELKNTSDMNEINRIENEIMTEIGQQEANITLNKMIEDLKEIWQQVMDKKVDRQKAKTQLDKIKKFQESTNVYKKNAYQAKSSELKNLIKKVNSSQTNQEDKGIAPWKIIVPVSGVLAIGAVIGILVFRSRRKKKERLEI